MLLSAFGRMLDNGGSLTRGFKDEWKYRYNKKHFHDNLKYCKDILSNKKAYYTQGYDIFGDLSLDLIILVGEKIVTCTIDATYDKSRNPYRYSTAYLNDYKEKDYNEYSINLVASYRNNLGTKLKLYSDYDKSILTDVKKSLLQEKNSDYYSWIQNNIDEFILDLEKQIF